MSDYSFMKSGFDLMQPDDEEFKKNATTVIVAYAENALRTAAMYVSHHYAILLHRTFRSCFNAELNFLS